MQENHAKILLQAYKKTCNLWAVVGWLLAASVALSLVYSTYSENRKDGIQWTRLQRAFYEAFGRPVWAACVGWVIFACHNNMGGIVNSMLSWNGFIPLMRLTYAAYLVHPICMMVYVYSKRSLIHINTYEIVYLFLGHTSITLMVAFVVSACFEAPFMALEKVIFGRK
ncbi:hypothetical protein CHS0354_019911 [Potamilus streckersoni]|uniref:Nose resistant to fluoxetine protein 6 n=1 Tax=Potamilus streckersoni TaxID=2493646 RepID=A0AAE0SP19_9BIVA|nr:hypothetical protein CHS0354_019911 [Potamilus streckersoni]